MTTPTTPDSNGTDPHAPAPVPEPRRAAPSGARAGSGPRRRAGRGPGRGAASRPPGRRDSRRPADSALRAAAHRERERQPPFWFARRLLLVLSGQCPVHTLLAHTKGAAYDRLAALAPLSPLRPRGADRSTPAVLEARGCQPRQGIIEAFARVATGSDQRAMAFRLELCPDKRWRCTAIEIAPGH
ncbi:Rv3235 family protein [Streptomyces iconiensis]|uniref:Rv3235 family protein n=1 Tax=Streptomyces iconiensis TaxID=1384038 RepID=A0ABT7A8G9_9ACTN|nr:Rv3235 family protein [Streptomyces iconiensis]MDJ1137616.1 Rv3235 family protein [Streptomyces iconiensis]